MKTFCRHYTLGDSSMHLDNGTEAYQWKRLLLIKRFLRTLKKWKLALSNWKTQRFKRSSNLMQIQEQQKAWERLQDHKTQSHIHLNNKFF